MTLNGRNAYAVIGNQKVISYRRNVRLMLLLLTYLFLEVSNYIDKKSAHSHIHVGLRQQRSVAPQLINLYGLRRYLACLTVSWPKDRHALNAALRRLALTGYVGRIHRIHGRQQ